MEFEILPGVGLGHIRIGMKLDEIIQLSRTYGYTVGPEVKEFVSSFSSEELDDFRRTLGEEDFKALLEALEVERNANDGSSSVMIAGGGIRLQLKRGEVEEITVSRGVDDISFAGERFFNVSPLKFLAALEKENGEPPLVNGPDCAFTNISVYVWAAFEVMPNGMVRFLREDEDEAQDKSVAIRANPRNPESFFEKYRPISFIR